MSEPKIVVLGVGNILMQDEGAGVHVVNKLMREYEFTPAVQIIDGGTMGSDLLPYFEEADKMIITDAVNFDEQPGFIGSIENDDIRKRLMTKLTSHHLGLTDVLAHAQLLDIMPSQIFLVGIQPETTKMDLRMSETVLSRMDRMVEVVLLKLKEWGVEARKR